MPPEETNKLNNKKRSLPKFFFWVGVVAVFIIINILSLGVYDKFIQSYVYNFGQNPGASLADSSNGTSQANTQNQNCNVAGIALRGLLLTYIPPESLTGQTLNADMTSSESVVDSINQAESDPNIKAILVDVDSNGGVPVAGEEIANALKKSSKPSLAVIRQSGLSAAYWAISSADRIFASRNSDVGSIGVTASYLDNVGQDVKNGNQYIQLSTGKYKDIGNPDKPLTKDEKTLIMRDLESVNKNFISAVAENRNLSVANVTALADGSSVLGDSAQNLGLVDQIGDIGDALDYIKGKIGEEPALCF